LERPNPAKLPNPEGSRIEAPVIDGIIAALRQRFGDEWTRDDDANLKFSIEVEQVLRGVDGAHLIGDPEVTNGDIVLTVWVDFPIEDLMSADQLAYDIFGRISEEMLFTERQFDTKCIRYPFVTGSPRHGHTGTLILAGPHAADFADRQQLRATGGVRFQA
jgi:hypothetical protein